MRTRLLGLAVLVFAAGRLSASDLHRHEHVRLGRRVAAPGDPGRQRQPRSRHDRLQHSRQRRPHDRAHHLASECHRRPHRRRLHAARLVAEHAAACAGNQRRPERRDQRTGRHAGALLVVSSRRRTHPGPRHQPLRARRDLRQGVSDGHRQLPRHDAGRERRSTTGRRRDLGVFALGTLGNEPPITVIVGGPTPRTATSSPEIRPAGVTSVQHRAEGPGQSHRHRRDRLLRHLQRHRHHLHFAEGVQIGGPGANEGNVIGGSLAEGFAGRFSVFQGNFVGTNPSRDREPRQPRHRRRDQHERLVPPTGVLGGLGPGEGNVIAHNGGGGIFSDPAGSSCRARPARSRPAATSSMTTVPWRSRSDTIRRTRPIPATATSGPTGGRTLP